MKPPTVPFSWRKANGDLVSPAVMGTPHLFNTVRCLWNSFMPEEARVEGGNLYVFPKDTHPPEYLERAIRIMLPTLLERKDLTPTMVNDLRAMAGYCGAKRFKLDAPMRNLM